MPQDSPLGYWEQTILDVNIKVARLLEWKDAVEDDNKETRVAVKAAAAAVVALEALVATAREKNAELTVKLTMINDLIKQNMEHGAKLQELQQKNQWKLLGSLITAILGLLAGLGAYLTSQGGNMPP